jgi:hypothetical protein
VRETGVPDEAAPEADLTVTSIDAAADAGMPSLGPLIKMTRDAELAKAGAVDINEIAGTAHAAPATIVRRLGPS